MRSSEETIRLAHAGLNPDTIRRLCERWGPKGALARLARRDEPARAALEGFSVEDAMQRLDDTGTTLVFDEDASFPAWLRELPDHPRWLFVRGALPTSPGVAVVGSRRATSYGLELAREIGRRIGSAGWPVISGLAAGIDTMGHLGCLDAGAPTTAVLGSGIDVWYPRRNARLGQRIVERGGVVSEFPPGTIPEAWRFPARNRIISGLSGAVIVVEAATRSGALITARMAVDHGRFVLAVPGDLARPTSAGANLLIRDGAHPVSDLDGLVEELEIAMGPAPGQASVEPGDPILAALSGRSLTLDELMAETGLPVAELASRVSRLELDGRVARRNGAITRR